MANNITNDANSLAQENQSLAWQMVNLYWQARQHREKAVALGITWDGNTPGVSQDNAIGNAENQLIALINLVEGPGVLTVLLEAAKIGG